jgi:hypothetical protein
MNVTDEDLAPYVLNDTFRLLCDVDAYFPVIFTGRPLPTLSSIDHQKLDLTYYGIVNRDVPGYFSDVTLTLEGAFANG